MFPRVLVIAGSDSSGGAGLEADQRVLTAHGVYSLTATTGLTAQNTLGVQDIHVVPSGFVRKQINAALEDIGAEVVKIGMLSSAETADVVAEELKKHAVGIVVLDPVMISTSGSQLLPPNAITHVRKNLLPLTTLLTPNIPEAKLLLENATGLSIDEPQNVHDMIELAKKVQKLGPKIVLLKGGHLPLTLDRKRAQSSEESRIVIDVLYIGETDEVVLTETDYLRSKNTHGTGCSLASAIAAHLAKQTDLKTSVRLAIKYIESGIKLSVDMGRGSGPINHFHSVYHMPFAPGQFVDYILNRPDIRPIWQNFTHHPFVKGLGDGSLPLENFKDYLVQDYLYLVHFARSNALASYKARSMQSIAASARIVLHIHTETALHIDYCANFGLTVDEMEATPEKQACVAYSRYILDIGQSEDWLALQMALAPCLIGYGVIARRLYDDTENTVQGEENNRYWKWIQNYVAEDYSTAVKLGSELLEEHMHQVSPRRLEELVSIFKRATELEIGFWEMGMGK